jgi:hypothetical protein
VKNRKLRVTLLLLVLGAATATLALSASGSREGRGYEVEALGVGREGSSGEQAREAKGRIAAAQYAASATLGPHVGSGQFLGESPVVADLPVVQAPPVTTLNARDSEHLGAQKGSTSAQDPVVQRKRGTKPLSDPIANFNGMCLPFGPPCAEASGCSCLPPDTNGAVGPTQFVQMVNTDFAVYSKTGAVLRHATAINQLWAGKGGECAVHNDGDPVVVYDQFANRWLLSQFVATPAAGENYAECIAVSQTADATGSYYLYQFNWGSDLFLDYPHIGVWPDGYYMSANEFPSSTVTSSGAAAIAFERDKMLAGQPAKYVWFDEAAANPIGGQYTGQLPANADGSRLPPAGAPNIFAEVDDPASVPPEGTDPGFDLRLWKFHVDWANPANSTFGNSGKPSFTVPVAPFVRPQCVYGYGDCALQKGGAQGLDVLGDRLMFRLAYRNFGTYQSLSSSTTRSRRTGARGSASTR